MIRIRTITLLLLLLLPNGYRIIAEDSQPDTKKSIQDDKIEKYRQKLISQPNDIELHRTYQNLMREMGKLEDAQEEYILKLAAEPQNPLYFYLYGRLLEGKELENTFNKAIELEVKSPNKELRFWLYFGLGQFYRDSKKYKEALNHLETAAKLKPDSLDVLHQTALVYYEMDNITEAMNLWDKILQVKKDYPDAFLGKALIYKSRGMYDNAIKELENILKTDVAFWRAYEPLIQCYHAKKDYKKGKELRDKFKILYLTLTDNNIKKHPVIVVDIILFNKMTLIVRDVIDNHHKDHSHYFYYFDFYKDMKQSPIIGYAYMLNLSLKTELMRIDYSKPANQHERFKIVQEPTTSTYKDLLDRVMEIEKR